MNHNVTEDLINEYYPLNAALVGGGKGAILGMNLKIAKHLAAARKGDLDSECRLINRLGQLKRCFPNGVPEPNRDVVREAVHYLRSVGRTVNLQSPDPREWISRRDGSPRW